MQAVYIAPPGANHPAVMVNSVAGYYVEDKYCGPISVIIGGAIHTQRGTLTPGLFTHIQEPMERSQQS
jgi:hypothetical protein